MTFETSVGVVNPLEDNPIRVIQDNDVLWLEPEAAEDLARELQSFAAKVRAARTAWNEATS